MEEPTPDLDRADPDRSALSIYTLGGFALWRNSAQVEASAWGREKALHLFQYFITQRGHYLHREQIIDALWPEEGPETGERDFKVALNAVNRVIEPDRPPRAPTRFIQRQDLAYALVADELWVDADDFETHLAAAHRALPADLEAARAHYRAAIARYRGEYLPERRYADWSSAERERLSTLAFSGMTALADLETSGNPREALRLTQRVLALEPLWEEAYRVQMRAYQAMGNRPMALRTYQQLAEELDESLAVEPLPETRQLYRQIAAASA